MNEAIGKKIGGLPPLPGVYIFLNEQRKAIYVGKAKSLKERVKSYFQRSSHHTPKTVQMLSEIKDLDIIVTDSELEALILEGNLIKKEKPKYNIVLRDDKNFPYLKLTIKEKFPRVVLVRRAKKDGNLCFGPYLPARVARQTLRMIPRFFKVAVCKERLEGKRRRPCLYYQLDQCLAPCDGTIDRERYMRAVEEVKLFLSGKNSELIAALKEKMRKASGEERYEEAASCRDTIRTVQKLSEKKQMISVGLEDQDYFAHYQEKDKAALQVFNMRQGLVQSRSEFTFDSVDCGSGSFYQSVISQYYAEERDIPDRICIAGPSEGTALVKDMLSGKKGRKVDIVAPSRGPKKDLLITVRKNAKLLFESRFRKEMDAGEDDAAALADSIGFSGVMRRIEAFDISNIQGRFCVASCIVFEGSLPSKKNYRRFRIRNVTAPDDYASMAEVISRRYRRTVAEKREMPDFILIDGGRGQLSAALSEMRKLGLQETLTGAFEKGEEKLYLSNADDPVRLDKKSRALNFIRRIRDEAHRFAVTYHRKLRSMKTLVSELNGVRGIGKARAQKLLRAFGSVEGMRKASFEEIASKVGRKAAESIFEYYDRDHLS